MSDNDERFFIQYNVLASNFTQFLSHHNLKDFFLLEKNLLIEKVFS